MVTGFAVLLFALLAAASAHDLAARTIPGVLCAAIALLGLLARDAAGQLGPGLAAAGLVFAGGIVCWRRGWLGGGDVKLLAAVALTVPPGAVPALLAAVAIAGAGLALLYLAGRRIVAGPMGARPRGLGARALRAERWRIARGGPLPYAVAIMIGVAAVSLPPAGPITAARAAAITWHGPEAVA